MRKHRKNAKAYQVKKKTWAEKALALEKQLQDRAPDPRDPNIIQGQAARKTVDIQEKCVALETELEIYKGALKGAEKSKQSMQSTSLKLTTELNAAHEKNRTLQTQLTTENQSFETAVELRQQVIRQEVATLKKKLEQNEQKLNEATRNLEESQKALTKAVSEKEEMQESVGRIESMSAQLLKTRSSVEDLTKKQEENKRDRAQFEQALQTKSEEVNTLRGDVDKLQQQHNNDQGILTAMRQTVSDLHRKLSETEVAVTNHSRTVMQKDEEIRRIGHESKVALQQLNIEFKSSMEHVGTLQRTQQSMESLLHQMGCYKDSTTGEWRPPFGTQ